MRGQVSLRALEHFNHAEDVSTGDDGAADIHKIEDGSKFLALLVGFRGGLGSDEAVPHAATVEEAFEGHKEEERDELQYD